MFLHFVTWLIVPHCEKMPTSPYCLLNRKLATILLILSNERTTLSKTISYIKALSKSSLSLSLLQQHLRISFSSKSARNSRVMTFLRNLVDINFFSLKFCIFIRNSLVTKKKGNWCIFQEIYSMHILGRSCVLYQDII